MRFINYIKGLMRRENRPTSAPPAPRDGGLPLWVNYGGSALSVSAVFRCVRFVSESVANLPLLYQRRKGTVFVDDPGSTLATLLTVQPNPNYNAFDFWRQVVQNMLLDGNAYILPEFELHGGKMEITQLTLCARGTVSHDTRNDLYTIADAVNNIYGTYTEPEIIHIKNLTDAADPKRGISTLTFARRSIAISSAADSEQLKRFESGGIIRGIISNGNNVKGFGEYQDEELQRTAEELDNRFHNQHVNIVTVPGQVDFRQLSMSSADMQFLESRKFGILEICRFFGVHPSFVFSDTSVNYKSAEQANVAYLSHTLNPLLRNIELELQRKLLPSVAGSLRICFDRKGVYACDLEGLMKYRSSLLQTGCSINELRKMENLPPVAGGDEILVSANLKSINEMNPNNNTSERDE